MQNAKHGRKVILTAALLLLFAGGLTAGYLYLSQGTKQQTQKPTAAQVEQEVQGSTVLKIYYPVNGYLQMEERVITPMILTREDAARATVQAYLRGPAGMLDPAIPPDVNLLGTYFSSDGVLFIDLSDAFRRYKVGRQRGVKQVWRDENQRRNDRTRSGVLHPATAASPCAKGSGTNTA